MKRIFALTVLLAMAGAVCAQSTIPQGSSAFSGYPAFPPYGYANSAGCGTGFTTYVYGAYAECDGTAACSPGSFFGRTSLYVSAAVQEFCTSGQFLMQLTASGELLGNHGIAAAAHLSYPGTPSSYIFEVFHDSNDDCNQAGPYNNNQMSKPCPPVRVYQ